MCNQRDFRRYADLCARMAEDDGFVGRHDVLQQMGLVFQQLAAEEARLEALIRDIDTFFADPADGCPQPLPWRPSRLH